VTWFPPVVMGGAYHASRSSAQFGVSTFQLERVHFSALYCPLFNFKSQS